MKMFRLLFVILLAVLLSGAVLLRTLQPDHRASVWLEVSQAKAEFAARKAANRALRYSKETKRRYDILRAIFDSNWAQIKSNILSYKVLGVEGTYRISEKEIIQAAQLNEQPRIWDRTPKEITEAIAALPWVEAHWVDWSIYPLSMRITIEEAEPWLVAEYDGHSWLLSRKNKLIVPLDSLDASELIVEASTLARLGGLEQGQGFSSYLSSANARLLYATKMITFLEMANSLPFQVERYELQSDGSILVFPQEMAKAPSVRLLANSFDEAQEIRQQLVTVLTDLRERSEKVELIDLRFENQAVVR